MRICVCVRVCFVRTGSALSLLYGTSATLEHHHFNHAVMILQSEVHRLSFSAAMQFMLFPCFCSRSKLLVVFVPQAGVILDTTY